MARSTIRATIMGSNTILLVEDSADDAELTSRALRRGNVCDEIAVVRDGVKALDYLLGRRGDGGQNRTARPCSSYSIFTCRRSAALHSCAAGHRSTG